MSNFSIGFISLFKGVSFSLKHFKGWFLVPIALWLILTIGLSFHLSKILIPPIIQLIESTFGVTLSNENAMNSFEKFFKIGLSWGVIIMLKILIWYVISRYMKYLILILLSPVFAYLSEKTKEILTGKTYIFNARQFLKDVVRGVGITCRNLFIETGCIVIGSVLSFFVPVMAPVIIGALFILNSYFMAFNFFDYVAERKRMSISESVQFMRKNVFSLIGFGVAYNLIAFFPLLDWVLAPISATSGAVIAELEMN